MSAMFVTERCSSSLVCRALETTASKDTRDCVLYDSCENLPGQAGVASIAGTASLVKVGHFKN